MPIINPQCSSLHEAIEKALDISCKWGDFANDPTDDIWYRGAKDSFDLLPSAYWKEVDDEYSSLITFRQLVSNYMDTAGYDDWDYYYLARHHGLPTRLLDWSEGIMLALFFAFDGWSGDTTPCVWMIRPHELNAMHYGDAEIICPPGKFSAPWLPNKPRKGFTYEGKGFENSKPIAIYPRRANPRIHGQQGIFTVHGYDRVPINHILEAQSNQEELIARIDLVNFDPSTVRRQLMYLGLRQSFVYPDADHLARDVGFLYGWE
ncbi:MAG: FRG domain-containing protein [Planctomycetota bacterium]